MNATHQYRIIELFVFLDDYLAKRPLAAGRRPALSNAEVLTILIWSARTENHQCLRNIYDWVERIYTGWFRLPAYQNFVISCHRALLVLAALLKDLLTDRSPLRFADSTMLPVCKRVRAKSHRVAKKVAKWGRNWQDWFFGFKLHLAIDHLNRICAAVFTGANEHDNQIMEQLVNEHTRVLVGDSHYGGSVQRRRLWRLFKTSVIAPAHFSQKAKVMSATQLKLLKLRPKVEAVFGYPQGEIPPRELLSAQRCRLFRPLFAGAVGVSDGGNFVIRVIVAVIKQQKALKAL